jgi:DeoR/GlpR family transcriptional regulator of sugar metabolism
VKSGSVVGVGAGTTTNAVAERLLNIPDLTRVTNSLPIEQLAAWSPMPALLSAPWSVRGTAVPCRSAFGR